MIRIALVVCGLLLTIGGALQLRAETRYLARGSETVAELLGSTGGAGLYIVLQPEDCLGDGELVQRWNALHRADGVPVRALVVGKELSERQQDLFAKHDVRLPLGSIPAQDAAIVAEKLGYASTPFAVVLDVKGRVAGAFPAEQNVPPEVLRRIALGE